MVLKVKDGDPGYLVLRAEAQSPKVCDNVYICINHDFN